MNLYLKLFFLLLAPGPGLVLAQNPDARLLKTFTNPTAAPFGLFGGSVAGIGSDRVLIGAEGAAEAYLFSSGGTLLTTFTDPTSSGLGFGSAVAAMGDERVLIGDYNYSASHQGQLRQLGRAYLFATNGTLLTTFTNPNPSAVQAFGLSVAAVGSDQVIIGSVWKDTGAPDAGAAYLFDLPYPPLGIALNDSNISVSWTTFETGILVQQSGHLAGPESWIDTVEPVSVTGQAHVFEKDITGGPARRFYRLHRP